MAVPLSMQSHVRESGHPCTLDPRRQEEPVHQMVQEVAQGQAQVTSPIQAIHTQEEEEQDPMRQEDKPQEEGFQAVIQVVAAHVQFHHHLQAQLPRSNQEEQVIQVMLHQLHLQFQLHPADQLIHGHHWIDPENHSRSSPYPLTIRVAASLICSRCLRYGMTSPHLQLHAQRYWFTQVLDRARA